MVCIRKSVKLLTSEINSRYRTSTMREMCTHMRSGVFTKFIQGAQILSKYYETVLYLLNARTINLSKFLEVGTFVTERATVADLSASSASVNNTPLRKSEKF